MNKVTLGKGVLLCMGGATLIVVLWAWTRIGAYAIGVAGLLIVLLFSSGSSLITDVAWRVPMRMRDYLPLGVATALIALSRTVLAGRPELQILLVAIAGQLTAVQTKNWHWVYPSSTPALRHVVQLAWIPTPKRPFFRAVAGIANCGLIFLAPLVLASVLVPWLVLVVLPRVFAFPLTVFAASREGASVVVTALRGAIFSVLVFVLHVLFVVATAPGANS